MNRIIITMVCILLFMPKTETKADIRFLKPACGVIWETLNENVKRYKQEQEDIKLMAEIIYHENWHTDKDHKAAYYTGAVVLNRVKSKEFPNTIHDVLYQTKPCLQYSTTKKFFTEKIPDECYEMAADLVRNGAEEVPDNVLYQAQRSQGKVWKVINHEYFCYG